MMCVCYCDRAKCCESIKRLPCVTQRAAQCMSALGGCRVAHTVQVNMKGGSPVCRKLWVVCAGPAFWPLSSLSMLQHPKRWQVQVAGAEAVRGQQEGFTTSFCDLKDKACVIWSFYRINKKKEPHCCFWETNSFITMNTGCAWNLKLNNVVSVFNNVAISLFPSSFYSKLNIFVFWTVGWTNTVWAQGNCGCW